MEKLYFAELEALKKLADQICDTRMMAVAKITMLILLNMRWERVMLDRELDTHPYLLVKNIVEGAVLSYPHGQK